MLSLMTLLPIGHKLPEVGIVTKNVTSLSVIPLLKKVTSLFVTPLLEDVGED